MANSDHVLHIVSIAQRILESSASHTERYFYGRSFVFDVGIVQELFEADGISWSPLVESDVLRVLNGEYPQYFLSDFDFADLYRERRGITIRPRGRFVSGDETIKLSDRRRYHIEAQHEKFGVSLWQFGHGYACIAESRHFYESEEWKNRAKAVRYLWKHRCSICKRRNAGALHAHHNTPIVSAYSHNFHLNFADYKLTTMCEGCHQQFHSRTVRGIGHYGFNVADKDEVKKEKERFRLLNKAHDAVKICPFCFGYRPGWEQRYINWPDIVVSDDGEE